MMLMGPLTPLHVLAGVGAKRTSRKTHTHTHTQTLIHTHTHTHTQRERERERERERDRERERERERERVFSQGKQHCPLWECFFVFWGKYAAARKTAFPLERRKNRHREAGVV